VVPVLSGLTRRASVGTTAEAEGGPPCSAECLNQDVRTNALGKRRLRNLAQLKADIRSFLRFRPTHSGESRPLLPTTRRSLRRSVIYLHLRVGKAGS